MKDSATLQWIAPDFVARPARGDVGNSGKFQFRNPGIHNWDMALFKNFPFGNGRQFQFRWEAYNVFNHTQYASVDTTARFNPAGQQINRDLRPGERDPSAATDAVVAARPVLM